MSAIAPPSIATTGRELSRTYPVWLCDVWGVVHDGQQVHPLAAEALTNHRRAGGCVVLITNAPRLSPIVEKQMHAFGVPENAYDAVVSSGDVTRELVMRMSGSNLFLLGPEEYGGLRDGLPVNWTGLEEADAVLCTGLNNDGRGGGRAEQPEDYRPLLEKIREEDLTFICANPDRVVGVGGILYPCAGALADIYEELGGRVEMAGKPYAPIYDVALERASGILGRPVSPSQVLAIGDGLPTDVAGACANDIPIHFVTGGIHVADHEGLDARETADRLVAGMPGLRVAGVAAELVW